MCELVWGTRGDIDVAPVNEAEQVQKRDRGDDKRINLPSQLLLGNEVELRYRWV